LAKKSGLAKLTASYETGMKRGMAPERRDPVEAYLAKLGKLGGAARAKALTARQRRRIAKLGGKALQAKRTAEERSAAMKKLAKKRWAAVRAEKKSGG